MPRLLPALLCLSLSCAGSGKGSVEGDADGTDGTEAADGSDGAADGADGTADGADGTADGSDGADGTDGTDGSDGVDGSDGDPAGAYSGTIDGTMTVGVAYDCSGPLALEVGTDGAVTGTATCESSPEPYTVDGTITGAVGPDGALDATWDAMLFSNPVSVPVEGVVAAGELTATFAFAVAWGSGEGDLAATR